MLILIVRCGKEVRYIIDYYDGEMEPGSHRFAQLDVRPAIDSFEALSDRFKVFCWRKKEEYFASSPAEEKQ